MPEALLAVERVSVEFAGFRALSEVTFRVGPGEVRALIGPNGAGKSTLLDVIIGKVRPASGRVVFKGREVTRLSEHRIARLGVGRKFQTPGVMDSLTVEDHLAIAARTRKTWIASLTPHLTGCEWDRVEHVLELTGLAGRRHVPAGALSHGERQWLEIGMVVATGAELVLLDEPTAGMTHQETALTAALIQNLAGTRAAVVVDHDMDFVEQLGSPVTVLHLGRVLREGDIRTLREDPEVAAVYLGRSHERCVRAEA